MDMHDEIRDLREKTARTRHQFLKAELETCFTALGIAEYELSVGHLDVVRKEVAAVIEGIRTIGRFLPEASAEQMGELEPKVTQLEERLRPLQKKLESATENRESGTS